MAQKILQVDVSGAAYDIHVGSGLLTQAGSLVKKNRSASSLCIVTDEQVAPLYLQALTQSLQAAGFKVVPAVILPAGEGTKDFGRLEQIIDHAIEHGLDRCAAFVALGGGVVGDITGFAAAVYMRGIPYVQIPTTLMAQVDSAVGGKTAVNTARGKNMAGVFHQPAVVIADVATLKSLPARELRAGYAEILKYALLGQPEFFVWLEQNVARLLAGEAAALQYAVEVSCAAKAKIVAADTRETNGQRVLLNLGHTFGHALEAIGGYDGRLLHGEAVSIGLGWAARLSEKLGMLPAAETQRIVAHIQVAGLMQKPPFAVKADDIIKKMRRDKKAENGKMTFILLKGIGVAEAGRHIDEGTLAAFLRQVTEE